MSADLIIRSNYIATCKDEPGESILDGYIDWGTFVINNLIPVTLGNIVGGGIFVGVVYWYVYIKTDSR